MSSLSTKDFKAILDIVQMVNDDQSEGEISQQALARLRALVGCESTFYSRVDFATGSLVRATTQEPHVADFFHLPGFHTVFHQHPALAAYRSNRLSLGTPVALTDLAGLRILRALPIYVDYHEPYGINDQMVCMVHQSGQRGATLSFNRARRGFSHRDRAVVTLLTPHVTQAVARQQRMVSLSAAIRTLGRHADQIDRARPQLLLLTSREQEVVEKLLGGITDQEIARSLTISSRTVHKHLENIYRKLHLGNRTSLIALIHEKDHESADVSFGLTPAVPPLVTGGDVWSTPTTKNEREGGEWGERR